MRVLALTSYPKEAAATRFRLEQFVEPLRERGIELTIRPFLDTEQFKELYSGGGLAGKVLNMVRPVLGRLRDAVSAGTYDVVLVQREAMFFGPAFFERLIAARLPMVLDLDDATYVHYVSPTYGKLGSLLKFFGKTDKMIRSAQVVICGNRFIAEYVESKGVRAVVVPTVVDPDEFCPREPDSENHPLVVGWIGTHSTFPFLSFLFPVLERLAEKNRFVLRIVGGGRADVSLAGVGVDIREWSLEREVEDFQSLDIGLYPIVPEGAANEDWIKGKSGFKAIQYMALGIPFVMSGVGVCREIGSDRQTHFTADTVEDWYNSLTALFSDRQLRASMGRAGREHFLENYSLEDQANRLRDVLNSVKGK
jgi:glycosyltransferase involved in cell wall biosynthesis